MGWSNDFGFACPGSARASGDVSPYKRRNPPTTHRERASPYRTSTNSARCANHVEGNFLVYNDGFLVSKAAGPSLRKSDVTTCGGQGLRLRLSSLHLGH